MTARASETVTWWRTDKSEVVKRGRKEIGRGRRPSKENVQPDQGPGAWKELCVQVAVAGAKGGTAPEGRPGTSSGAERCPVLMQEVGSEGNVLENVKISH